MGGAVPYALVDGSVPDLAIVPDPTREELETRLGSLSLGAARTDAILNWEAAPHARTCHAEEDHLVPLFTALGAAEGDVATRTYHQTDIFGGVTASSWRFG